VGEVPLDGRHRPRDGLDPRRPGSDDRRRDRPAPDRVGQWDRDHDGQIGTAAAVYVAGACCGALFFGQLTDRFGRKKLFLLTLGVYILATLATAASWTAWFFFLCRFFTGAGIGGEYAAINSAIDELIPARVRGRVDLIINGSYWVGAAIGSAVAILLLDKALLSASVGWRLAFLLGA
jgi:MFS family permease